MRDEWLKPSPQFDAPEFCSPSLLGPDWCWSNLSLNIYTTPIALSTSTTNERSYVESLVIEEEDDEEKKFKFKWKFLRRKTWQQQKKTRKERIFLFKKTFLFSFFVRVKKYFFRSNYLRSLLSFTVVLLELSWRHLSLYKKCCFPHTFLQFFFFIIINIIIIIIWFWFFVETKTKK